MRSGFVSLLGRKNAGKSTLINALLNEKITLVSHKKNATRRKISAIIMHEKNQIIITDTPGLHPAKNKMGEILNESALRAGEDCDLLIFVASIFDKTQEYENFLARQKDKKTPPHIVVITKVDLADNEALLKKLNEYASFQNHFAAILPFSCKKESFRRMLLDEIVKFLPEHAYFYEPELLSVNSQRELFCDLILESIYEKLSEELPYSSEVIIEEIIEDKELIKIEAMLITDSNSHKAMIIGKNAQSIKRIGQTARAKIAELTGKKIFLKLTVSVKKNWQRDEEFLKKIWIRE